MIDWLWIELLDFTASCAVSKLIRALLDGMLPGSVDSPASRLSRSFDVLNQPKVCGIARLIPL